MLLYLIRRLNLLAITIIIINLLAFLFNQSQLNGYTPDQLWIREFGNFVLANFRGEWGVSSVSGKPVFDELLRYLPATLELCITAIAVSFIIGIPLGTLAGVFRQHWLSKTITSLTIVAYSIPIFWFALLIVMSASLYLGGFPVSGRYNLLYEIPHITGFATIDTLMMDSAYRWQAFISVLGHLALPGLVLAVAPTTEVIRLLSNSVIQVMSQNYIKAAFTQGFSRWQIVRRHVLHNALPPILPNLSLQFGHVLTTAMVLEIIFAWPGIGRWLITSIYQQDYAAIQGGLLSLASIVICTFVITDLFTAMIHPLRRKEVYAQI